MIWQDFKGYKKTHFSLTLLSTQWLEHSVALQPYRVTLNMCMEMLLYSPTLQSTHTCYQEQQHTYGKSTQEQVLVATTKPRKERGWIQSKLSQPQVRWELVRQCEPELVLYSLHNSFDIVNQQYTIWWSSRLW